MKPLNKVKFHRNPAVYGIEACLVEQSSHRFPKHSHDNLYAVSMMVSGGSSWDGRRGSNSIVEPGNIAVIPAGQMHSGEPLNGEAASYHMLYIDSDVFMKAAFDILENDTNMPRIQKNISGNRKLLQLFSAVFHNVASGEDPLEADSYFSAFTAKLISEMCSEKIIEAGNAPGNLQLERAAECLASDLDQKISLDDAADAAGLSKYYLLRSFKARYGISPHLFRLQKRIDAARKLIQKGLTLSDVAVLTGFTDQSHLTNQFRKYTGATPGQYV